MKPPRKRIISALKGIILVLGVAVAWPALAQTSGTTQHKDLVLRGDAKCTRCHDEGDDYPVLAIAKTPHGTRADLRTPTCTSCHGESTAHIENPGGKAERPLPDRMFRKTSPTPISVRNGACLTCHQGGDRIHWTRSPHQQNDVACTSCHRIHTQHDKVRDRVTQDEVCFTCHKDKRVMLRWPSRHPIEEGKVVCSDCHNPHGTAGPNLLVRDSVNDTCYTCHMEKRGPFIHSHPPVQEDCTICHNPHGSTNPNLLKVRPPFLCQSCHEPSRHPGTLPVDTPVGAPPPALAQAVIMARGCVNCHTNIHGSNTPTENADTFRH